MYLFSNFRPKYWGCTHKLCAVIKTTKPVLNVWRTSGQIVLDQLLKSTHTELWTMFTGCTLLCKITVETFENVCVAEILNVHSGQAWDLELFTKRCDLYVLRCIDRTLQPTTITPGTSSAFSTVVPYHNKHLTSTSVWPWGVDVFAL